MNGFPYIRGATSVREAFRLLDSSQGAITTLAHNTAGLVAEYRRSDQSTWTTITLVSGTLGAWVSGGFVHDKDGIYELDVPNAAFSSGDWVMIRLSGSTISPAVTKVIQLSAGNLRGVTSSVSGTIDANTTHQLGTAAQGTGGRLQTIPQTQFSSTAFNVSGSALRVAAGNANAVRGLTVAISQGSNVESFIVIAAAEDDAGFTPIDGSGIQSESTLITLDRAPANTYTSGAVCTILRSVGITGLESTVAAAAASAASAASSASTAASQTTPQKLADAMKETPAAGSPEAGSVFALLNAIPTSGGGATAEQIWQNPTRTLTSFPPSLQSSTPQQGVGAFIPGSRVEDRSIARRIVSRAGTSVVLLARVVGADGDYITQADIASAATLITNQLDSTTTTSTETVSAIVYDTLQTDGRWTEDALGYNVAVIISGSRLSVADCSYLARVTLTDTNSRPIVLEWEIQTR